MSITARPFKIWDCERLFWTDPNLSAMEKSLGVRLLRLFRDDFTVPDTRLKSQREFGYQLGMRRETVNRALRKLVFLGYFRTTWKTISASTAQGIKGVTRVLVAPGRVILEKTAAREVSAGKPRGVTETHTPAPPGGRPGTDCASVVTQSAGSRNLTAPDAPHDRRKTLAQWPRLAGSRADLPSQQPSAIPVRAYTDPDAYRRLIEEKDAALENRMVRRQPRRLPRSKRK